MKVYIAAPWTQQARAKKMARLFEEHGLVVTSSWLEIPPGGDSAGTGVKEAYLREQAHHDISDILRSDYLVCFNWEKSEGKAFEMGLAIQAGMSVISVGKRHTIFALLTHEVPDAEAAIAYIKGHTPTSK